MTEWTDQEADDLLEALAERKPPEYETYPCEEVGKAWQELRRHVENGGPLTWTGPDRLHHSIAATSPPPSHYLTKKGRKYDKEQGRDIWDTLFLIAFQVGFHNGAVSESVRTRSAERAERSSNETATMFRRNATALQEKINRCEVHMREILGYKEGERDAGLEAMVVQAKRRDALTEDKATAGEVWQEADNVILLCVEPGVSWRDFNGESVSWDAPTIARPLRRLLDSKGVCTRYNDSPPPVTPDA